MSQLSVSALLIWKPTRKADRLLRILFVAPNAHQLRVLTALEALHSGLPCIHQAEPHASSTTSGSGTAPARKGIGTLRPATAGAKASPLTTVSSKSVTKVETRPVKSALPSGPKQPKSTSALKTKEAVKDQMKKTAMEVKKTKVETPSDATGGQFEVNLHAVTKLLCAYFELLLFFRARFITICRDLISK